MLGSLVEADGCGRFSLGYCPDCRRAENDFELDVALIHTQIVDVEVVTVDVALPMLVDAAC